MQCSPSHPKPCQAGRLSRKSVRTGVCDQPCTAGVHYWREHVEQLHLLQQGRAAQAQVSCKPRLATMAATRWSLELVLILFPSLSVPYPKTRSFLGQACPELCLLGVHTQSLIIEVSGIVRKVNSTVQRLGEAGWARTFRLDGCLRQRRCGATATPAASTT